MKIVKFNVSNGGYNVDEIASFDDKIADRLIDWKVATEYKEKKTYKAKKSTAKTAKPRTRVVDPNSSAIAYETK